MPRATLIGKLYKDADEFWQTIEGDLMLSLWSMITGDYITEKAYQGAVAGLSFDISRTHDAMEIVSGGYDNSLAAYTLSIIDLIQENPFEEEMFNRAKEIALLSY